MQDQETAATQQIMKEQFLNTMQIHYLVSKEHTLQQNYQTHQTTSKWPVILDLIYFQFLFLLK